jgi:hypothetical protein
MFFRNVGVRLQEYMGHNPDDYNLNNAAMKSSKYYSSVPQTWYMLAGNSSVPHT